MGKKEAVFVEATKVVEECILFDIEDGRTQLMEIIEKRGGISETDVFAARQLVRDINCLLRLLFGNEDDLYERERYHLFQDPNGWLSLVKGREISDEPF
jgi:hypothetical protein